MQIELSQQIRYLRLKNGMTQAQVGQVLGVTAQAVSRWEKGDCYPDLELIPDLADFFGVSIDGLLQRAVSSTEK